MVVERVVHYPALGKEAEVRALLEEKLIGNYQSRGVRCSLMSRVLIDGGAVFVTYISHGDMETYEKFRDTNASDRVFREMVATKHALSRRGVTIELFNTLVPPSPRTTRYYLRVEIRPNQADIAKVRSILEEATKGFQSEGRLGARLTGQILAPAGAVFIFGDTFETLTELENTLIKQRSAIYDLTIERTSTLLRAPMEQGLYDVLVPFEG